MTPLPRPLPFAGGDGVDAVGAAPDADAAGADEAAAALAIGGVSPAAPADSAVAWLTAGRPDSGTDECAPPSDDGARAWAASGMRAARRDAVEAANRREQAAFGRLLGAAVGTGTLADFAAGAPSDSGA